MKHNKTRTLFSRESDKIHTNRVFSVVGSGLRTAFLCVVEIRTVNPNRVFIKNSLDEKQKNANLVFHAQSERQKQEGYANHDDLSVVVLQVRHFANRSCDNANLVLLS
jgi:hypothetical protein